MGKATFKLDNKTGKTIEKLIVFWSTEKPKAQGESLSSGKPTLQATALAPGAETESAEISWGSMLDDSYWIMAMQVDGEYYILVSPFLPVPTIKGDIETANPYSTAQISNSDHFTIIIYPLTTVKAFDFSFCPVVIPPPGNPFVAAPSIVLEPGVLIPAFMTKDSLKTLTEVEMWLGFCEKLIHILVDLVA